MRISDWSSDVCSSDLTGSAWRPPSTIPMITGDSRGVSRAIMALPPARPLTLHLRRDGVDHNRSVIPIPACRSRFEVVLGNSFLAQADGELVQIGSRFLADYPQWVAAPIAHESIGRAHV